MNFGPVLLFVSLVDVDSVVEESFGDGNGGRLHERTLGVCTYLRCEAQA